MTDETKSLPRAELVRSFDLEGFGPVHGVTCDDRGRVWFAHDDGGLVALDPDDGRVLKRITGLDAQSGTAFDGKHLWQITPERILCIDPDTDEVRGELPRPEGVHCSGMAFANGSLWIGDYLNRRLVEVDASTGAVKKTLESDRLVTGVTWIDEELWHGGWENREEPYGPSLRRIDPESGSVLDELALPDDWSVSGTGVDAEGRIWCGGSHGGGLRAVRRP